MITKEKLKSLEVYKNKLEESLRLKVPHKHQHHHESYRNFLKNEIRLVDLKVNEAKLEGIK